MMLVAARKPWCQCCACLLQLEPWHPLRSQPRPGPMEVGPGREVIPETTSLLAKAPARPTLSLCTGATVVLFVPTVPFGLSEG